MNRRMNEYGLTWKEWYRAAAISGPPVFPKGGKIPIRLLFLEWELGVDPTEYPPVVARVASGETEPEILEDGDPRVEPDWETPCEVCEAVPTVPLTGLCGPCTWGEAETVGGNW